METQTIELDEPNCFTQRSATFCRLILQRILFTAVLMIGFSLAATWAEAQGLIQQPSAVAIGRAVSFGYLCQLQQARCSEGSEVGCRLAVAAAAS